MRTSGLVLDIYDDFQGEVLRSIYPEQNNIPELVKQAHSLTAEERAHLPDDVFALVLVNDGERSRKYACTDPGNTQLAVDFFLKTSHKLPIEAQKVAASNLVQACEWYGLETPEHLKKVAFLGAALAALPAIETAAALPGQIRQGLAENEAMGQGGRIVTPRERDAMRKTADVVGTNDMPLSPGPGKKPGPTVSVIQKSAGTMGRLVQGTHARHHGDESTPPDDNCYTQHGEQPPGEPQSKSLRPHVDVSNSEPTKVMTEKKADLYALPSVSRYPLDSYAQVQAASEYFDKYASHMLPEHRREYCVNLVKRAEDLSIPVSDMAHQYGASGYAPEDKIAAGYNLRRQFFGEGSDYAHLLESLYEKRAEVDPELFAETLSEFDKVAQVNDNYDRGIPDPYASTFGVKVAEEWSEVIGNDVVTEQDLRRLGKIGTRALKSTFSEDFSMEFRKNPVDIFKSLPLDQKKLIMRMAVDNSGPGIELTA